MKKKHILILMLLAIVVLVSYLLLRKSEVVLNVSQRQDGGIDFLFDYKKVNGLYGMRVWEKDSRTLLWGIEVHYFKGDKIKYGEVPSEFLGPGGVPNSTRQVYPLDNQIPKAIPLDKEIYVSIDYQYDHLISACIGRDFYVFKIKPKLSVEKIDVAEMYADQLPRKPEYLSYEIPDNAVENEGPPVSEGGTSTEYWVGDQLVAGKTIYPNGNTAALIMYKDGKQHGPHRGWYDNGVKRFEMYFYKGVQCNFSKYWHDNGKLKTKVFFEYGYRHGHATQWNRKGELLGLSIFNMGTGTASQWHENGRLKRKVTFTNGKLHGTWEEWDEDGNALPSATKHYFEGKQVDKSNN